MIDDELRMTNTNALNELSLRGLPHFVFDPEGLRPEGRDDEAIFCAPVECYHPTGRKTNNNIRPRTVKDF
jgi:hypothetical protein